MPSRATETLSDRAHLEAENDLLRQRLAIAEGDLAAAKGDVDAERARIASWQDAFGVHDAEDPKDKVRATIEELDAKTKRVAELQMALGIGEGEAPASPDPRPLSSESSGGNRGGLPAWGQLLLLTQLAKHHPLLGASYYSTPDVLHEANGDRWTALRQETTLPDGTIGHVVTVQRTPSTFSYEEARTQTIHLEGELASALRGRAAAERAARANLGPGAKEAAQERLKTTKRRVEEIQSALESLKPRLTPPEVTEWRTPADLDAVEIGWLS